MKRVLIAALMAASVSASAQTITITPQTQTYGYQSWTIKVPGSAPPPVTQLAPPPVSTFVLPDTPNRMQPLSSIVVGAGSAPIYHQPDVQYVTVPVPVQVPVPDPEVPQLVDAIASGYPVEVVQYAYAHGYTTHQIMQHFYEMRRVDSEFTRAHPGVKHECYVSREVVGSCVAVK